MRNAGAPIIIRPAVSRTVGILNAEGPRAKFEEKLVAYLNVQTASALRSVGVDISPEFQHIILQRVVDGRNGVAAY
ncbi:hypothetical protein SDC9_200328 [bioreactor metagenome]|uniref:Uncharacterized protein n=1 Tax=bioreactor metagenome TaxID=1076179 RepID=A0A645INM8_9ZZZZ